ncbi:MAG: DMT family transporter [Kiritimatiellae bacterium]|nr:DMT family transporter [Kiritimatiellia bacterium]
MAALVRLADDYGEPLSAFQKSFFRNLVAFAVAAAVYWRQSPRISNPNPQVPSPNPVNPVNPVQTPRSQPRTTFLLLARAAFGTLGIFANFYALSHIPIATGQMLNKTAPFFTVAFAWAFLGERTFFRQAVALAVAFAGAMLVVKPGFAGAHAFPLAVGLLGGAAAGAAYACVRALRRRGVDPAYIILYFSVFSCLSAVPFMLPGLKPMTFAQVAVLLGAGGAAAVGQFGVTLAYGYAAPRDIAVYDYSSVLFAAAFGYFFFAQVPDIFSVLGFAVILAALVLLNSRRRKRPHSS